MDKMRWEKALLVFWGIVISFTLWGDLRSIRGEEAIWREKEGTIYFRGNVEIVDTELILKSNEIKVEMEGNNFSKISGEKGVEIVKGKEKVEADTFLLLLDKRIMYLGGKVKIQRGEVILESERGVFDLSKGKIFLKGKIKASFP